jgi:hypothetical protein
MKTLTVKLPNKRHQLAQTEEHAVANTSRHLTLPYPSTHGLPLMNKLKKPGILALWKSYAQALYG